MIGTSSAVELTETGNPLERPNAGDPAPAAPQVTSDSRDTAHLCFDGVWAVAEEDGDLGAAGGLVLRADPHGWRLYAGEHVLWAEGWDEVGKLIVGRRIRLPDGTTGALVQRPNRQPARTLAVPGQQPRELADSLSLIASGSNAKIKAPQREVHPALLAPAIAVIGSGVAYLLLAAGHVVHP